MLNWWCELPAILPEPWSTSSRVLLPLRQERAVPVHSLIDRHRANPQEQVKRAAPATAELCQDWGPLPAQPCASGNILTQPRQGQHGLLDSTAKHDMPMSSSSLNWAQTWLGHSRIKAGLFEKRLPHICLCRCGFSWCAAFQQDSRATQAPAQAGISTQGGGWRGEFSSALSHLGCPKINSTRSNKTKPTRGVLP